MDIAGKNAQKITNFVKEWAFEKKSLHASCGKTFPLFVSNSVY